MSFSQVSAPAIEYAEGFPIAEEFAGMLRGYQPIMDLWPASKAFYYPNGTPPQRGDIVRMPTLANTLRELAAIEKKTRGNRAKKLQAVRDLFYKGSIAKRVAGRPFRGHRGEDRGRVPALRRTRPLWRRVAQNWRYLR